jgi:hypothetical protein
MADPKTTAAKPKFDKEAESSQDAKGMNFDSKQKSLPGMEDDMGNPQQGGQTPPGVNPLGDGLAPAQTGRLKVFSPQEEDVARQLLTVITKRYENPTPFQGLRNTLGALDYNQPMFARFWIPAMQQDPHLIYGIRMLNAPIMTKAKFKINATNPAVAEYVDRMIKRFWFTGLPYTLTALEYGYCGVEVVRKYNRETKFIEYDKVLYRHQYHTEPILVDGCLKGMRVKHVKDEAGGSENKYVGLPKCLWTVHERKFDRWYGRSRYAGAFIPWYEYWQPKGFRNIRHLAMYKYSFRGPNIGYPEGAQVDTDGNKIHNVVIASRMADRAEAGATLIYPTSAQEFGGWEIGEPSALQIPEALMEYGDDLKREKWEGLGIPPEVAESEDSGGFAGRRVPQQAFYSNEQEIANEQVFDFDEQCLRYDVALNFGHQEDYEIEPIPIIVTLQQEEMANVTGHMPGDPNDTSGIYGEAGLADGEEGADDEGSVSGMADGRIEDRKSNAFNKKEKAFAK